MKFPFEKLGFSFQPGDIEPGSFRGPNQEDGPMAENLNVDARDALRVIRFELLRDAQKGSEQAKLAPALAIQSGVGGMIQVRLGFRVVITHERPHHVPPPSAQPGDFAVADQILAVAVVRFAIDEVSDVVQQAFACVGLEPDRYVRIDPALVRPPERTPSVGDAGKAHAKLGWEPLVSFEALVEHMVQADLRSLQSVASSS